MWPTLVYIGLAYMWYALYYVYKYVVYGQHLNMRKPALSPKC